jgi:hypothetical protein
MRLTMVAVLVAATFPVSMLAAQSTRTSRPAPTPEKPRPTAAVAPARGSTESHTSIGLRVGTLGVGLDISHLISDHIGLRVGASYLKLSHERTFEESNGASTIYNTQEVTWNVTAKVNAFSGLVDWYPGTRGVFRFSVGAVTNPLKGSGVGVIAQRDSVYRLNGRQYKPASIIGNFIASSKYASVLPYLGIGFGTPASKQHGFGFIFDLGAAIGTPTVALTSTNAATTTNPTLRQDLAGRQNEWQTETVNKIPVYPVLSIGAAYRF